MKALLATILALGLSVGAVWAKPARCFTTDDGHYPCEFQADDAQGSFTITAPGRPTYMLQVDSPGTAFGFLGIGGRNVALPGTFERERADPACWRNSETDVRVCAR